MVEVSTHPPEFDASGRGTCSRRKSTAKVSSFVAAVSVSAPHRRLRNRIDVSPPVCRQSPRVSRRVADAPGASRAPIGPRRVALARQLIDTLVGGIALWPFAPLGR